MNIVRFLVFALILMVGFFIILLISEENNEKKISKKMISTKMVYAKKFQRIETGKFWYLKEIKDVSKPLFHVVDITLDGVNVDSDFNLVCNMDHRGECHYKINADGTFKDLNCNALFTVKRSMPGHYFISVSKHSCIAYLERDTIKRK